MIEQYNAVMTAIILTWIVCVLLILTAIALYILLYKPKNQVNTTQND